MGNVFSRKTKSKLNEKGNDTNNCRPVDCCWVVARVQEMMMKLAKSSGILVESIDSKKGDINGTLLSTVLMRESKTLTWQNSRLPKQEQDRWQEQKVPERGNPVKVIEAEL